MNELYGPQVVAISAREIVQREKDVHETSHGTLFAYVCPYIGKEGVVRTEPVEIRLGIETRRKLDQLAAARGLSIPELLRSLIERSYEEAFADAARLAAAERIGRMEIERMPEPAELKRQFAEVYEPGRVP